MNKDATGLTYVKLGRNPIWESSALFSTKPTFGLKIECDGNCVGMPCSVDGNGVVSDLAAIGAGGADFCIVTVPKGSSASIVVYNLDGSTGSTTTTKAAPTTIAAPTYKATTIATTQTTPITSTTTLATSTSYKVLSTSVSVLSSATTTSVKPSAYGLGGIFQENGTSSSSSSWVGPSSTATSADTTDAAGTTDSSGSKGAATTSETSTNQSAGPAHQGNAAIVGLIIALVAAGCIL